MVASMSALGGWRGMNWIELSTEIMPTSSPRWSRRAGRHDFSTEFDPVHPAPAAKRTHRCDHRGRPGNLRSPCSV